MKKYLIVIVLISCLPLSAVSDRSWPSYKPEEIKYIFTDEEGSSLRVALDLNSVLTYANEKDFLGNNTEVVKITNTSVLLCIANGESKPWDEKREGKLVHYETNLSPKITGKKCVIEQ